MCAKYASMMEMLILDDVLCRRQKVAKRNGEAKRREEREGKREMTTIETFDFVAKEVTLTGDANRVLCQRRFLKFSK